jgi:putative Mg2+ transporter-C (MgtC) family protein
MWHEIGQTIQAEFSDIPDAAGVTRVTMRLLVAALLGGIIGFEREWKGRPAGLRTHMLVALGSALFVLVPQQALVSDGDLTRVLQGLIAGIGFLGAGTIIKHNDTAYVEGLTTAASIWMTAAIGIAAGMGREATAFLSTLVAMGILSAGPLVSRWIKPTSALEAEAKAEKDAKASATKRPRKR